LGADRELGTVVDWTGELRRGFERLRAGERPRLDLSGGDSTVDEIGVEFNALVTDVERMKTEGASREQVHRARNRLAGILAALQVFGETGELETADKTTIRDVIEEAKKLDAQLR
jgi:hypothetical protein